MITITLVVYIDGVCEPYNPGGVGTYGFVVYKGGERIYSDYGVIGEGSGISNNLAEYTALVMTLKWIRNNGYENEKIIIRSDSQLLVNQMKRLWIVRKGFYTQMHHEAVKLCNGLDISFEWIPRDQNKEADRLSKLAYKNYVSGR